MLAEQAMHAAPDRYWTVVQLAAETALSRSAFYGRFNKADGTFKLKLPPGYFKPAEGKIIVPFREPVAQASSLLTQHTRFLTMHREHEFTRRYMADIGHFEFGLLHRRYIFVDHDGKNLRGIDELIRPVRHKGPTPKQDVPYVARFHLHPDVRARLIEHQMALLETPGGQRWRLRTDAPAITIEPSIYWGGPAPREGLQIVLSGAADPMGHGLAPPNRVRWALSRS